MHFVLLSKERGGEAIRTDRVAGNCKPPAVGKSFELLNNEPVEEKLEFLGVDIHASHRYITTSPVQEVEEYDWGWKFETLSGSIYRIEVLQEPE